MTRKLLFCAALCMLGVTAFGQNEMIEQVATGFGRTRPLAVKNALENAISQATGVQIESQSQRIQFESEHEEAFYSRSGRNMRFDSVAVDSLGTAAGQQFKGTVRRWEVTDSEILDDGSHEVTIRAYIQDFKPVDINDRIRLAIMPFRADERSYDFASHRVSQPQLVTLISQELTQRLTAAEKFGILDREKVREYTLEKEILLSGDTPLEEKARLSQVLGADYMLTGTVQRAEIIEKVEYSHALGRDITEYEAHLVIDYRLIAAPTRYIKAAGTVSVELYEEQARRALRVINRDRIDHSRMARLLIGIGAQQLTDELLTKIYPVKIASVRENEIVIDQGSPRIKQGDILEVFKKGEEIIDADTGESRGEVEVMIAEVRVEKADEKLAYAKVIEGDPNEIEVGDICRPAGIVTAPKPVPRRPRTIRTNTGGGVKLPFDK